MSSVMFGQKVFFGGARPVASVYPASELESKAPLRIRQDFRNELGEAVTVAFRNGLPVTISSQIGGPTRQVIISHSITITGSSVQQTANFLDQITEKHPTALQRLKKAYDVHAKNFAYGEPLTITLEYAIDLATLRKYGREMYHHELDCFITTKAPASLVFHPYSSEGMMQATIWSHEPQKVKEGGAMYVVEIIDNTGVIGDRFLNIANEIYHVRAKKDSKREDGVYITRTDTTEGELGSNDVKVNYIPYLNPKGEETDLTAFHLFRSFTDAKTLGDLAGERKKQLTDLEHQVQTGKRELELQKQHADRDRQIQERENQRLNQEIIERDRRYKELETERERIKHELEMRRLREKDFYEDRSQRRKDSSELMKMLPGLLLGAVALVGTILNMTKK